MTDTLVWSAVDSTGASEGATAEQQLSNDGEVDLGGRGCAAVETKLQDRRAFLFSLAFEGEWDCKGARARELTSSPRASSGAVQD